MTTVWVLIVSLTMGGSVAVPMAYKAHCERAAVALLEAGTASSAFCLSNKGEVLIIEGDK